MALTRRKTFLIWHRWFGLLAGFWLLLMAITGAIIVFYDELDRALNPDLLLVKTPASAINVASVQAAVEAAHPDRFLWLIDYPNTHQESGLAQMRPRPNTQSEGTLSVYFDSASNALLGERRVDEQGFNRRHILHLIYELHIDLMLGQTMMWLLGLVALLWLLDHIAAFALSFPNPAKWRRSFVLRWRAGDYKRLFDIHRASGLWLYPVTLVLAFSGLYFNWYSPMTSAINWFSPLQSRAVFELPALDQPNFAPALNYTSAEKALRVEIGNAPIDKVMYFAHKGVYEFRLFDPRDIDPYGRRYVVVNATHGGVQSDWHITEGNFGNQLIAWQYPLHSGKAFGWPGRLLIFGSGLMIVLLAVSGLLIWLRKRRAKA